MITPGDVDDHRPLEYKTFLYFINGKMVGDRGYISKICSSDYSLMVFNSSLN